MASTMKSRGHGVLVGTLAAVASVAAIAPGVRAADEGVVAKATPVAAAPAAATVGGEPTAVLTGPGTATVQLPFRLSLTSVDSHQTLPSGALSVAVTVTRGLELSLAATAIPLDAVYGPADLRLGARIALHQEGGLRVALIAGIHAPFIPTIRQVFAAEAGLALTHCRDQACRASATLFGTVDRHLVRDWVSDEQVFHFDRSQAAVGASATLPFSWWGNLFASGRASSTFGCGNVGGATSGFDPCLEPSTLLTATAGARVSSADGRLAFDLAASVVHARRLEEFNFYQSVPHALFVGATFTAAMGGRGR
jgi:hypothetical protein